jgi:hypothetical protein
MKTRKQFLIAALATVSAAIPQMAAAQSWDVQPTFTPGAPWTASSPWEARAATGATCSTDLGLLATPWNGGGSSLPGVSVATNVGGHFLPAVFKNTTSSAAVGPQTQIFPTQVALHPGTNCAVLRFKAPQDGIYKVNGEFFAPTPVGTPIHPQHVNARILDKGTQVHTGVVSKPAGIQNWAIPSATNYHLQTGQSIDFAVDMGNNYFYGDTVLLTARVTRTGNLSNNFKATKLDAEGAFSCAIEQGTSQVHCWGDNGPSKVLGISAAAAFKNVATPSDRIANYLAANPSYGPVSGLQRSISTTCAKTSNSPAQTFCWGGNNFKVAGMSVGGDTLIGNVPAYGLNNITGQLGNYQKPRLDSHNGCLVVQGGSDDGKVRCWGINDEGGAHWYRGNLGYQTPGTNWSPSDTLQPAIPNVSGASGVSSGYYACAITDGALKNVTCWGHAGLSWGPGVMGGGTAPPNILPGGIPQVQVKTSTNTLFSGADKILVRGPTACALKAGSLYCWGLNATYGTLLGAPGPGFNFATLMPGPFATGVTDFALGDQGICAIRGAGAQVFCQGVNIFGQMGRGNTDGKYYTFTSAYAATNVIYDTSPVAGIAGATSISAGRHFFCVTTNTTDVKCWGVNNVGQLGNGTTTHSGSPVTVIK